MEPNKQVAFTAGFIVLLILSVSIAAVLLNPQSSPNSITTPSPTPPPTDTPDASTTPQPTAPPTTHPKATAQPTQKPSATASPTQAPTPAPTVTPIPSPSPYPTPDPASVVFSDSFQSGNLSLWTSTDTSGVALSVENSMLKCETNTNTSGHWGYVYKWLNQTYQALNWRWYLFFGNLPTSDGNIIGAGGMYNSAIEGNFTAANGVCAVNVVRQNGSWHWNLAYVDQNQVYSLNSSLTAQAGTWYLVELKAVRGNGTGEVHFYLNDKETLNATGLVNCNNAGIDHVSVGGGVTANQAVCWYCTSAIASTQYIGPKHEQAPQAPAAAAAASLLGPALLIGGATALKAHGKLKATQRN
ncbi:MAG: hypothetical protein NWE93_10665 [Candidatus Bathyarchaeota archaeon]|nr:hypothetical protein [Candidatus Bathyarchaeota archaeon]